MMGLILFPMLDLFISILNKDKDQITRNTKYVFFIGLFALLGFVTALVIHADLRGSGDIAVGLRSIWESDVLRRTLGGSKEGFSEAFWPSLDASIGEVLQKYFHFSKRILIFIPGFLFMPLCMLSLLIGLFDIFRKKKKSKEILFIYVFSFLTSISWFVLGKSHSFIHTHLNYVLWYFGYIQITLYLILKSFLTFLRDKLSLLVEIKSIEKIIIKEIEEL